MKEEELAVADSKNKHSKMVRKILAAIVAVAIIGVLFALLEQTNTINVFGRNNVDMTKLPEKTQETINYTPPTDEEKNPPGTDKTDPKNIPQPPATTTPPPTSASSQVEIAALTQEGSGKAVVVSTKLYGTGWQKCTITLTRAGSTDITDTADTLYQADFSTCLGFSFESSRFTAGSWKATLSVTNSNGETATSASKEIVVQP